MTLNENQLSVMYKTYPGVAKLFMDIKNMKEDERRYREQKGYIPRPVTDKSNKF